MPFDMSLYLENMRKFLENRPRFPLEELAKYAGCWVAWSPDGMRIVAGAPNLEDLENLVQASGEDPLQCVLEGIPDTDSQLGGFDTVLS